MTEDLSTSILAGNKTAADTFQSLARIYLTSAERLSALNLTAAREAVEDQTAVVRSMMGTRNPEDINAVQNSFTQPMINKALAYSRGAYEILAETQLDLSKLMVSQMSKAGGQMALPTLPIPNWTAAIDMFRAGARQFTDMAAQNANNAAETASSASAAMKKSA